MKKNNNISREQLKDIKSSKRVKRLRKKFNQTIERDDLKGRKDILVLYGSHVVDAVTGEAVTDKTEKKKTLAYTKDDFKALAEKNKLEVIMISGNYAWVSAPEDKSSDVVSILSEIGLVEPFYANKPKKPTNNTTEVKKAAKKRRKEAKLARPNHKRNKTTLKELKTNKLKAKKAELKKLKPEVNNQKSNPVKKAA